MGFGGKAADEGVPSDTDSAGRMVLYLMDWIDEDDRGGLYETVFGCIQC